MPNATLTEFFELLRTFFAQNTFENRPAALPKVAVIMGAQVLSGGRPSPALEARVRHGAELYLSGEVETLIPTGGLGEYPPSEADLMLGILRDTGVPEDAVIPEDKASNTWGSAIRVAEISRRQNIEGVRVVTDPLHCVRTVWSFREAGIAAWAEPAYDNPMWQKLWSRSGQLVREFAALTWYKIHYREGSRHRR